MKHLEPFDEWEEWHLASAHYMVMAAFNGEEMNAVVDDLRMKLRMQDQERRSDGERRKTSGREAESDGVNEDCFRDSVISGASSQCSVEKSFELSTEARTCSEENKCASESNSIVKDFSSIYGHAYRASSRFGNSSETTVNSQALLTDTSNGYMEEQRTKEKDPVVSHTKNQIIVSTFGDSNSKNASISVSPIIETQLVHSHLDLEDLLVEPLQHIPNQESGWFKRFGHCTAQIGDEIYMVGGFGQQKNGHARRKDLTVYAPNFVGVTTVEGFSGLERLFATCTALSSGRMCVFGGRLSPQKACTTLVILRKDNGEWKEDIREVKEESLHRWRHTANVVEIEGELAPLITRTIGLNILFALI